MATTILDKLNTLLGKLGLGHNPKWELALISEDTKFEYASPNSKFYWGRVDSTTSNTQHIWVGSCDHLNQIVIEESMPFVLKKPFNTFPPMESLKAGEYLIFILANGPKGPYAASWCTASEMIAYLERFESGKVPLYRVAWIAKRAKTPDSHRVVSHLPGADELKALKGAEVQIWDTKSQDWIRYEMSNEAQVASDVANVAAPAAVAA